MHSRTVRDKVIPIMAEASIPAPLCLLPMFFSVRRRDVLRAELHVVGSRTVRRPSCWRTTTYRPEWRSCASYWGGGSRRDGVANVKPRFQTSDRRNCRDEILSSELFHFFRVLGKVREQLHRHVRAPNGIDDRSRPGQADENLGVVEVLREIQADVGTLRRRVNQVLHGGGVEVAELLDHGVVVWTFGANGVDALEE